MESGATSKRSCSRYPRHPPTSPPLSMIAHGKAPGVMEPDPADTHNLARLMVPGTHPFGSHRERREGPGLPLALPAWVFFDPPTYMSSCSFAPGSFRAVERTSARGTRPPGQGTFRAVARTSARNFVPPAAYIELQVGRPQAAPWVLGPQAHGKRRWILNSSS